MNGTLADLPKYAAEITFQDNLLFEVTYGYIIKRGWQLSGCRLNDILPQQLRVPSCQYTLDGKVKATNESSIIDDISNVDDDQTINLILNSNISISESASKDPLVDELDPTTPEPTTPNITDEV